MNEHIQELFDKYLSGTCTSQELQEVQAYIKKYGVDQHLQERMDLLWEREKNLKVTIKEERPLLFQQISERIQKKKRARIHQLGWIGGSIAAAVILAVLGIPFFKSGLLPHDAPVMQISKTTGNGQKIKLLLPDSSVVYLNSASKISFPEKFNAATRTVTLEGEAYFEVKHQTAHPFVVHSGSLKTTVLGTTFNVRSYADDKKQQVTVLSGKVGVSTASGLLGMLLPGDQINYSKTDGHIEKVKLEEAGETNSWKDNKLVFRAAKFSQVARVLERWYNVKVTLHGPENFQNCAFNARFNPGTSLKQVMYVLQRSSNFKYQFNENTLSIRGSGCKY